MNWVAPIKDDKTLQLFEDKLREIDDKYYIMFMIGVGTGLQVQDILQLKNKDIRGKQNISVCIGAKNVEQTFDIPEDLQKVITDYTEGKDPDAYLIVGYQSTGEPLSREQAYRVLKNVGHSIGLTSIGAQTMRKTWAWRYYNETGDIEYLQNVLNHASPSITYRYIGEKPNVEVALKKMTPEENERSRYMLYKGGKGKLRIQNIKDCLDDISMNLEDPCNNDAYFGKVDCFLTAMEELVKDYKKAK